MVILCDDLGYGDISCYGNKIIKTPNIDRLASQGIRFTDYYSPSPVCSPSRVGLLTGRTPNRAGIYDWIPSGTQFHLEEKEFTIPKMLKRAGYATCMSGKWHCNGKFNKKKVSLNQVISVLIIGLQHKIMLRQAIGIQKILLGMVKELENCRVLAAGLLPKKPIDGLRIMLQKTPTNPSLLSLLSMNLMNLSVPRNQ